MENTCVTSRSPDDQTVNAMLDLAPLGCILLSGDLKVARSNQYAADLFKFSDKDACVGFHLSELIAKITPEYQAAGFVSADYAHTLISAALKDGGGRFQLECHTKAENSLPFDITCTPAEIGGQPHMILYMREQAEYASCKLEQTMTTEQRLQSIIDAMPMMCCSFDTNSHIVECNQAAVDLFNMSSKQEYLDRFDELSPEYQPDGSLSSERSVEYVARAVSGETVKFEWMHINPDTGENIPCEVKLIRNDQGSQQRAVAFIRDLRDYYKMKEIRERTQHRLQAVLDSTPMVCAVYDRNHQLLEVNRHCEKLFRIPDKQMYLDNMFNFLPEFQPDGQRSSDASLALLKMGFELGSARYEFTYQAADGELIPVEESLERVRLEGRDVLIVYTRDLREEKAAAKKERESYELTRAYLDSAPFIINVWDDQLNMISTSHQSVELFGLESQQQYMDEFPKLSPAYQPCGTPSAEKALRYVKEAFETGYCRFEWQHQTINEETIPAEIILVRAKQNEKDIVLAYTIDQRAIKGAMDKVEQINALLTCCVIATSTLLDAHPHEFNEALHTALQVLAVAVGVDRVYVFKNYAEDNELFTTQLYEWSNEQAGIQPQQGGIYTTDVPFKLTFPNWLKSLSRGEAVNLLTKDMDDKERKWSEAQGILAIMLVPLYVKGEFWGFMGFDECRQERVFDINELSVLRICSTLISNALLRNDMVQSLNDVATDLEDALDRAREANRAKSAFLSHMSHEIRTPMNAIIGMTSIGKSSKELSGKDYAFDKIGAASVHLLGVINDILDISKIEYGKYQLYFSEFVFDKSLDKAVNIAEFKMNEKNLKFSVYIDPNIPLCIIGDEHKLTQVVTNLLSNAVKFTPEGGEISLAARLVEDKGETCKIQVEVVDSGIGISPAQQARLFLPFEQAESSTTRNFGGTGLGLSISKAIIGLMDGEIWVESDIGQGAKFAFYIQVKKGTASTRYHGTLPKDVRILVVDDDSNTLEYFINVLGRFGCTCNIAQSAKDALKLIEETGPYHLYFVDWLMPEMDGVAFAQQIRSIREGDDAVIIMISSSNWAEIEYEARKAKIDDFLPKPMLPSDLVDCLSKYLIGEGTFGEAALAEQSEGMFGGYRMLLAEDVEINREIVMALLEPTGLEIACAVNGVQAVKMFSENPDQYDVIFMDVQMPEMDGLTATQKIRALGTIKSANIPIIALTADVFIEDVDKCLRAGMNAHLGKPLNLDDVIDTLMKFLLGRG
ncbi:MAG: response regulator [Oscillospiraceae bacterium]|nr:response regulator [Oscillospiraceae bacterium]